MITRSRIRYDVDQTPRSGRKFFKIELEQRRAVILIFLRLSMVYSIKYIRSSTTFQNVKHLMIMKDKVLGWDMILIQFMVRLP